MKTMNIFPRAFAATLTATAMVLASCSSTESGSATGSSSDSKKPEETINLVASTSIWSDVAESVIEGSSVQDKVEITPIIEGNNTDPHHFEPAAQDIVRATEADVVVVGGGGYDAWLYDALENQDNVVHALPLVAHNHEGHEHGHEHGEEAHEHGHEHGGEHGHEHGEEGTIESIDGNEHIWYDTTALEHVAEGIAEKINEVAPEGEKVDITEFEKKIESLHERIHELPEMTYAKTEPIADYILAHSEMKDETPESYRKQTLSHGEPTASDLNAFLEAIKSGDIDVLIYNPQTKTDLTDRIRKAAEDENIPVVEIGETPPEGANFFDYYSEVLDKLESLA